MSSRILKVELGERSYPITITPNCLADPTVWSPLLSGRQVMIVTNTTLSKLLLPRLQECLESLGNPVQKMAFSVLPDGESYKNLSTLDLIFDALLEQRFDRRCIIVALGGGVVGDMAGFAAACYQRGVDFIQAPTTLLSQVDSSVGGKTGVNHALGKNMVGAFYQPQAVIIDTAVLESLPEREMSAGLAEVIKYGLIYDEPFLVWLEDNMDKLLAKDAEAMSYAIYRSCQVKAEVVAQDEREGGIRAILNLGHTYGHAIENHQGYGKWLHGEAVGAGMVMASDLSCRLGWISPGCHARTVSIISRAKLPTTPPEDMSADDFMAGMSVDKKVLDGQLRLVLLKEVGRAIVTSDFSSELLQEQLAAYQK